VVPTDEALAPAAQTRDRTLGAAGAAFILATTLGLIAARRMTAPITALRAATQRVAEGDYEAGDVLIKTRDEMEDLAHDFSKMAARLRQSLADLREQFRQAEEARARMRAVLDATSEGIFMATDDGQILT